MGFWIEWKCQIAKGNIAFPLKYINGRYCAWVGYAGIVFSRVDLYDNATGKLAPIMSFEEYVAMNDGETAFLNEIDKFNSDYRQYTESTPTIYQEQPLPPFMPESLKTKYKL